MKRFLIILLLCVLLLAALPVFAEWEIDEGTLVISGTEVYGPSNIPWSDSADEIYWVEFEGDVTVIGENYFTQCTNLGMIVIPQSIHAINNNAIPSTTVIYAYEGSTAAIWARSSGYTLKILDPSGGSDFLISEGVLFRYCGDDADVVIPDGVTKIEPYLFGWSVESVTVPDSVTEFDVDGMRIEIVIILSANSPLIHQLYDTSRTLEINVDGSGVFTVTGGTLESYYGSVSSLTIPNFVNKIGSHAFSQYEGLTSIDIPASVTEIGPNAFENCYDLESVTLHIGLKIISDRAFQSCTRLTSVTIPDGVIYIGDMAFSGCYTLTNADIPASLVFIGDAVFSSCSLTEVTLSEFLVSIGSFPFDTNVVLNVYRSTYAAQWAGSNGYTTVDRGPSPSGLTPMPEANLEDFWISNGVVKSYKGSGGNVVIPAGVISIGSHAFTFSSSRSAVTGVTIPEGVETIESGAFQNCENLARVTLPSTLEIIEDTAFYGCEKLVNITLPEGLVSIGDSAFGHDTALKRITIPEGVTTIGDFAFQQCDDLQQVTLPSTLQTAGRYAFSYTPKLTNINLPQGVTEIPEGFLQNASALKEIAFPASVTTIGYLAFQNTGFSSIVIPEGVSSIGSYAFSDCPNLTRIDLPNSLTYIGASPFSYNVVIWADENSYAAEYARTNHYKLNEGSNTPGATKLTIYVQTGSGLYDVTGQTITFDLSYGEPMTLVAKIPGNDTPNVTWKSSAPKVAAITSDGGVFTPLKIGNATITATLTGTKTKAAVKFKFTSSVLPNSLRINGETPQEVTVKKTLKLTATFTQTYQPGNKAVVWTSTVPSIAKVSANGVVTGVAYGSTVITACPKVYPDNEYDEEDFCDTITVNVLDKAASLTIEDEQQEDLEVDLNEKNTYQLNAVITPATAIQTANWKSSAPKVATVDENGLVTFKGNGKVTITAASKDGGKKATVKLTAATSVLEVHVSGPDKLLAGKTGTYTAQIIPSTASNKKVIWSLEDLRLNGEEYVSSSKTDKVTMKNGKVTVGKNVPAGVTFKMAAFSLEDGGIYGEQEVTVVPLSQEVHIYSQTDEELSGTRAVYLDEQSEMQLTAKVVPEESKQDVTWKSGSTKIASVDKTGKVVFKKAGTVTITATAADGSKKAASVKFNVQKTQTSSSASVESMLGMDRIPDEEPVMITEAEAEVTAETAKAAEIEEEQVETEAGASEETEADEAEEEAPEEITEPKAVNFDAEVIELTVGESVPMVYESEAALFFGSNDESVAVIDPDTQTLTALAAGETTVYAASLEPMDVLAMTTVKVAAPEIAEAETEPAEEAAELTSEAEAPLAVSFDAERIELTVGESVPVVYGSESEIRYGSSDTAVVTVDEMTGLVTGAAEGETTVFAMTVDPLEVKAMLTVSVKAAEVTETAEAPEEPETAEPTEPTAEEPAEETEMPAETEETPAEETTETPADEAVETEETTAEPTAEPVAEAVTEEHASAPEAEKPEIVITDLPKDELLSGTEAETIVIKRERFELDDELLGDLVFKVENESIVKLTERTAEETALYGIELKLLSAGETKLKIGRRADEEPLREIRIVVNAPAAEEAEPAAEVSAPVVEEVQPAAEDVRPVIEEAPVYEEPAAVEPVEEPAAAEPVYEEPVYEETVYEEPAPEPEPEPVIEEPEPEPAPEEPAEVSAE